MRADFHHARSIAANHRPGFRLEHERRKSRGAHAPADQHAGIVARLSRRERAFRPAEALGALGIAFAQGFRGERLAGNRLDVGIVLEAEGKRIDPCGPGRFIDGAFQRNRTGGLAGRTHEQRRAGIDPDGLVRGRDRRTGV